MPALLAPPEAAEVMKVTDERKATDLAAPLVLVQGLRVNLLKETGCARFARLKTESSLCLLTQTTNAPAAWDTRVTISEDMRCVVPPQRMLLTNPLLGIMTLRLTSN